MFHPLTTGRAAHFFVMRVAVKQVEDVVVVVAGAVLSIYPNPFARAVVENHLV